MFGRKERDLERPKAWRIAEISGGVDGTRTREAESHETTEKQASPSLPSPPDEAEPPRDSGGLAGSSPGSDVPNAELTLDVLRRKRDAAIVAEAWEAVAIIAKQIAGLESLASSVTPLRLVRTR